MVKKGQTFIDVLVISIVLLVVGISFVLMNKVQDNIHDELVDSGNLSPFAEQTLNKFNAQYVDLFDNIFLLVFILLWVFIIVSSIFADTHPIFLIISFILLIFVLIFVAVASNTYQTFVSDGEMYLFSSEFVKMNYIMEHLVLFIMGIAMTSLIAIYGKNQVGG
jgi:hypothetical protein